MGLCMQVTTCATLVNTQTDMQTRQLSTGYTIRSASRAIN